MSADLLQRYHFDPREFEELQRRYRSGELSLETNVITYGNDWEVGVPLPEDTAEFPGDGSPESRAGAEIISSGTYGLILMNGGAATRFQKPGERLPKGAFEIMEEGGRLRSFMELKLAHARWASRHFGARLPVWILNSYFTDERTREILSERGNFGKEDVFTYCQGIMKRVIPSAADIRAHYGKALRKLDLRLKSEAPAGRPALEKVRADLAEYIGFWADYGRAHAGDVVESDEEENRYNPPGHLDTTLWLILDPSRPLLTMVDLGIEYLGISNIDNLGATVDPALPGLLALRERDGVGILCEVSVKPPGQKGGTLARVYAPEIGREWPQIVEEFAFPPDFDQDAIPDFNNATYTVSVRGLLDLFGLDRERLRRASREELIERARSLTDRLPVYVAIKELKELGPSGEVDRPVVQFERLQGDLTRLLTPLAVKTAGRFFPVKKREDIPLVVPELRRALAGRLILD
ncbi:MAG TPA: UTP--glucose-1-phosphate uridylyltransferase [bacterium]|nr:UTP--glucose-1-phosphate uridylyltransferase [bacterium]HPJ71416.1 UTP--glucose-1-phosphate uridylyltransferase [bacterium]HPQ65525.1 UTP--glucose-1-phosphate uridylyltransferase [bacterium]